MNNYDRSFLQVGAGIFGILLAFVAGIAVIAMAGHAYEASGPCVEGRAVNGMCTNAKHRIEVMPGAAFCRCPHTLGTPASATPSTAGAE